MPQDKVVVNPARGQYQLRGMRRLIYWMGRILQGFGLLLIWWVLLLFTGFADMWTLLFWTMAAALVFYLGWVCTLWPTRPGGRTSDVMREGDVKKV